MTDIERLSGRNEYLEAEVRAVYRILVAAREYGEFDTSGDERWEVKAHKRIRELILGAEIIDVETERFLIAVCDILNLRRKYAATSAAVETRITPS